MTRYTSHQKISTPVNLYCAPEFCPNIKRWTDSQQIPSKKYMTVGDLHASVLRLVTHWVQGGVATISENAYRNYASLTPNQDIQTSAEQKKSFEEFFKAITITENAIGFRSIGDNLADRDVNDYFILKLYQRINNKKILYSNHDVFFMLNSGLFLKSPAEIIDWILDFKKEYPRLVNQHRSFLNLAQWVADGVVQSEELKPLVDDYRSALHLLDYDVDLASDHISLYSHAPIDFEVIESLAQEFRVQYRDDTIAQLCETIDAINAAFQAALQNPEKASALYQKSIAFQAEKLDDKYLYPDYPLFNITWSRPKEVVCGSNETAHTKPQRDKLYLPANKQYDFTFIHGHVGAGPENNIQHKNRWCFEKALDKHYVNVDTNAGKWCFSDTAQRLVFSSSGEVTYYLATHNCMPTLSVGEKTEAVFASANADTTQPHWLAPIAGRADDEKKEQGCCLSRCCAALFSGQQTPKPTGVSHVYSTMPSC